MLFPQNRESVKKGLEASKIHLEKTAFDPLTFGTSMIAGEAIMSGISRFGKNRGANFLRAGIEHGKAGEKMNPYTEGVSRNLLGNKQLAPYDAGLKVGNRIRERGMSHEKGERFLNKVIGIGSARSDRLFEETGKKVKDPVLKAVEGYQSGKDRGKPLTQALLNKGTRPQQSNSSIANVAVNTAMLPAAALDFRAAARPAIRAVENNPRGKQVTDRLFPSGSKREKSYSLVRNYID